MLWKPQKMEKRSNDIAQSCKFHWYFASFLTVFITKSNCQYWLFVNKNEVWYFWKRRRREAEGQHCPVAWLIGRLTVFKQHVVVVSIVVSRWYVSSVGTFGTKLQSNIPQTWSSSIRNFMLHAGKLLKQLTLPCLICHMANTINFAPGHLKKITDRIWYAG